MVPKKKAKPHKRIQQAKRAIKVKAVAAPITVPLVEDLHAFSKEAPAIEIPDEQMPVVETAFYAPEVLALTGADMVCEPHHAVLEIGGKKSLWRRICEWMDSE